MSSQTHRFQRACSRSYRTDNVKGRVIVNPHDVSSFQTYVTCVCPAVQYRCPSPLLPSPIVSPTHTMTCAANVSSIAPRNPPTGNDSKQICTPAGPEPLGLSITDGHENHRSFELLPFGHNVALKSIATCSFETASPSCCDALFRRTAMPLARERGDRLAEFCRFIALGLVDFGDRGGLDEKRSGLANS